MFQMKKIIINSKINIIFNNNYKDNFKFLQLIFIKLNKFNKKSSILNLVNKLIMLIMKK